MYLPDHFVEERRDVLDDLIGSHPLGVLVTMQDGQLVADHIPWLVEAGGGELGSLIGHVARRNALWNCFDPTIDALVIFQGPAAYISPNWYATKSETHEVVPTYNYVTVHVTGPLQVHDDPRWIRGVVGKLTKRMESSEARPWKMADGPRPFIDSQIAEIVGIEIPIARITGKWKVSQNRVDADRYGASAQLRERGMAHDMEMAELIERQR